MKNTKAQLCVERKEEVQELRLLRPDSCWSWLVCAASGITTVLNGGIFGSFGLLLSPLMEDFGVTRFDAGNNLDTSSAARQLKLLITAQARKETCDKTAENPVMSNQCRITVSLPSS